MASLNRVILLGNLTRDPVLRYTGSGTPVATLSLAVSAWRPDDPPCYIDVVVFHKPAEACADALSKGQPVLVEGSLRYRTWETHEGSRRTKHEVMAQHVEFLARVKVAAETDGAEEPPAGESQPGPALDDDIPF